MPENYFAHQDLETLIIRGKNHHVKQKQKRDGSMESKPKHISDEAHKQRKLDQETENLKVKRVDPRVSKAIIAGRTAKNLTRKQLSQRCPGLSEQIITSYETGKAVPNINEIRKIEKGLGVKLTGKDFK